MTPSVASGMSGKSWFITGASRGFGRIWAVAALERGDRVVATARDVTALAELGDRFGGQVLALQLDVTDRSAAFAAVAQAAAHFDGLDVVVNNAGYPQQGMVEELSEAEVRGQVETNFFGAVWVTQAALPIMRAQRSGHVVQISSVGGVTTWPGIGMYSASKWALEGITQALAEEVSAFGIRVTLVEPGGYATDPELVSVRAAQRLTDYDVVRDSPAFGARRSPRTVDPSATAAAMLTLVDLDDPPLRLFLGEGATALVEPDYQGRLDMWRAWDWLAREAGARS